MLLCICSFTPPSVFCVSTRHTLPPEQSRYSQSPDWPLGLLALLHVVFITVVINHLCQSIVLTTFTKPSSKVLLPSRAVRRRLSGLVSRGGLTQLWPALQALPEVRRQDGGAPPWPLHRCGTYRLVWRSSTPAGRNSFWRTRLNILFFWAIKVQNGALSLIPILCMNLISAFINLLYDLDTMCLMTVSELY